MPSPWIDLLHLHGYLVDPRWLRKPETPTTDTRPSREHARPEHITLANKVARTVRLCLGIGDGVLRSQ